MFVIHKTFTLFNYAGNESDGPLSCFENIQFNTESSDVVVLLYRWVKIFFKIKASLPNDGKTSRTVLVVDFVNDFSAAAKISSHFVVIETFVSGLGHTSGRAYGVRT